ncbi:MAG: SIR2 family protein [Bacteroidota bacterium]
MTYEIIIESILQEECILALGPGILVNDKGKSVLESLRSDLLEVLNTDYREKYRKEYEFADLGYLIEELMSFSNGQRKWKELRLQYLNSDPPNSFYEKIAELPFNLILTTCPDGYLDQAIRKFGVIPQRDYLTSAGRANTEINQPLTKDQPAVFSLFGSAENPESLVLDNYNKLTQLISNFYRGENRLPALIEEQIKQSKNCVFLGFDYSKWYFNILLDILQFNNNTSGHWDANYYGVSSIPEDQRMRHFYQSNFKIEFFAPDDTNALSFIDELHTRFREVQPDKIRKISSGSQNLLRKSISDIRSCLKESDYHALKKVLEAFPLKEIDVFSDSEKRDNQNLIIRFSGRIAKTFTDSSKELLTREATNVEFGRISDDILNWLNVLEEKINE